MRILNIEHWEINLMDARVFRVLLESWSDERRLRFRLDELAYQQFVLEYLTAEDGSIAKALGVTAQSIQNY